MTFFRYIDVALVVASAPVVLIAGLPATGYLLGAGAWILTRAGVELVHSRARRAGDPRVKAGLHVAAMMGRVWIVVLAVIVARFAASRDDGIVAAVVVLAAFTVQLAVIVTLRGGGQLVEGSR